MEEWNFNYKSSFVTNQKVVHFISARGEAVGRAGSGNGCRKLGWGEDG